MFIEDGENNQFFCLVPAMSFTRFQSGNSYVIAIFFVPQHGLKEVKIVDWGKARNTST
jgi:hypothetical protein